MNYKGPRRPFDPSRFGDPGPILHPLPEDDGGQTTSEVDAGIAEYANATLPGFSAIIKHRYSDFNVSEVDINGQVVHLKSLALPNLNPAATVGEWKEVKHADLEPEEQSFFTHLTWMRLVQLGKKAMKEEEQRSSEAVSVDVSQRTKEERTQIHGAIRKYFPHLVTVTEDKTIGDDLKKVISVGHKVTQTQRRADDNEWPRERPKFLHFTLYKEDLDSTAAFSALSQCLGKKYKFTFAGTKDKRSRSAQRCAISFVTPRQLSSAAKRTFFNRDNTALAVGDFSFEKTAIKLGHLKGNHFAIVLRNVESSENALLGLQSLKTTGFINYYGLQRFGNSSIMTSDIGLAIIRGRWQEAVELILKPRSKDRFIMKEARKFWWQYRKSDIALRILGSLQSTIEGLVFKGLKLSNEKFGTGALNFVSKNTRLMYIHAYQSLIWNKAVSRRIQKFGLKVLVGDLYTQSEALPEVSPDEKTESTEDTSGDKDKFKRDQIEVLKVTEDNVNEVGLEALVMPLPGTDVIYPDNAVKEIYEEVLKEDDLDLESFKNASREYTLGGDYRKLMGQAEDLKWRFIRYSEPNKTLILSDLNRLKGLPEVADEAEGPYQALIMELTLKSSHYATMAIREISKMDTGKTHQGLLTEKHVQEHAERKKELQKSKLNEIVNGNDGEPSEKKAKVATTS